MCGLIGLIGTDAPVQEVHDGLLAIQHRGQDAAGIVTYDGQFHMRKGAGLVRSKRGVGGGYVLARDPEQILLSEIVRAVDGPITAGDFGEPHTDGACDHEGQCVLLAIWAAAGAHMRHFLESFTLADIATMARGDRAWPDPVDGESP